MEALLPNFVGFLLVLMRCAALFMVAPLLGARVIPARIRLALALSVSMVAFMAAGGPTFAGWARTDALVLAALAETLVGLTAGLAARFFIDAAASAGHAVSIAMGLGYGAVLDPMNGAESTALSQLLPFVALGIAVAAGIHREAIAWLCRSVVEMPPGSAISIPELASNVVAAAAGSAALSVRLGFPVLAAVTFGHIGLGILTRTAPQLNLANVGFSVAILAGGGALYLVAPGIAEISAQAARRAFVGG